FGSDGVEHGVSFVVARAGDREIAIAWASQPRVQLATYCQDSVSECFGLQSLWHLAPHESIIVVHRRRLAHQARLLPVRGGQNDQPLNPLQAPGGTVRRMDQLPGQPIEQLRM